jgi:M6 family metalloprotease-like protein
MGPEFPGMSHYWAEVSGGAMSLEGSIVLGWFTLPHPRQYYVFDGDGDGIEDLQYWTLAQDCTAAADAALYFPSFFGINMLFNGDLGDGGASYGGSASLSMDGISKTYGATWISKGWYDSPLELYVIAHEMGHGFGLPHSLGAAGESYGSGWDLMSSGFWWVDRRTVLGVHTIAFHKDFLGWIPPDRKYVAGSGDTQTIRIERLAVPSAEGFLMAQIPIGPNPNQFYTVEARRFAGYDQGIPGEGVVIHQIDTERVDPGGSRPAPAVVVDKDSDGDPNDEGAIWVPGETFVVPENGVRISIVSSDATGSFITVDASGNPSPVLVILPSGGERWKVGTTQTISWEGGNGGNVGIELSRDAGKSWEDVSPDTANDGSFRWRVTGPASGQAIIRVSSGGGIEDAGMSEQFVIKKRAR